MHDLELAKSPAKEGPGTFLCSAIAKFAYHEAGEDRLHFEVGDVILVEDRGAGDWWLGREVRRETQVGDSPRSPFLRDISGALQPFFCPLAH